MKKEFCAENYKKIFEFFKNAFALTHTYYKLNEQTDMPNFELVENAVAESFE